MKIIIRDLTSNEQAFHKEMVYLSLWDPPDQPARSRHVLEKPVIEAYYENWGKPTDIGMVAQVEGCDVGLVSCRIKECVTEQYQDFAEVGIAVLPDYQGRGIGTLLMQELIARAKNQFKGLRLGVHPENNRAIKLYEKFGFSIYDRPEGQYPQMALIFDEF